MTRRALRQLINLETKDLKTRIYRVFNVQRLLEACSSRKNVLVRPTKWDDPFENFILATALKVTAGRQPLPVKDNFYGQCWSVLKESDAMWRIYSPEKTGVKVTTTIGKLYDSLAKAPEKQGECFIGKVKYLPDQSLRKRLMDKRWLSAELADTTSKATSLLFKRKEFAHEHELRLLYLSYNRLPEDLFAYSTDPLKLFDEIQFDPRLSDELFKVYSHYLVAELGFKNSVTKSKLYQLPNLQLK